MPYQVGTRTPWMRLLKFLPESSFGQKLFFLCCLVRKTKSSGVFCRLQRVSSHWIFSFLRLSAFPRRLRMVSPRFCSSFLYWLCLCPTRFLWFAPDRNLRSWYLRSVETIYVQIFSQLSPIRIGRSIGSRNVVAL